MTTQALTLAKTSVPSLHLSEDELMQVLSSSLYPGATPASIKMVIGYCKAANLDPMQKPVHLVPMSVKDARTGQYDWRDVVMPGIGLYRTQAARSGCYAGVSEPEFGEDVTTEVGGVKITFPQWCRVTVRRALPTGQIAEFSATERWLENYATKSKDSNAPNAMWKRRPYAQLAKCTEAQALRKAFPEIGAAPTADEMEGKEFEQEYIDGATGEIITPKKSAQPLLPPCTEEDITRNICKWRELVCSGKKTPEGIIDTLKTKVSVSEEQRQKIMQALLPQPEAPEEAPPLSEESQAFVAEMEAA